MEQLIALIWNIADDVLRDVFLRGQYRDVILPMVVLRRLDALLEPTKEAVEQEYKSQIEAGLADNIDEEALKDESKQTYYNISKWTLNRLKNQSSDNNDINYANFIEYLNGYSENVKDVLKNFEFYAKVKKLADNDRLISIIERITDPRQRKLKGKAKAMVVTKDIECAIHYYKALTDLVVKLKLPYKVLIAFSGEKEVNGVTYTEAGLNGFAETETAERFESDENRILVVANKYLTGFDQPKLCAMYIDKPLAGVLAVQALSRLNRAAPDLSKRSEDLFILDFYNKKDDMEESFSPFYTSTTLSEPTDVNILHELRSTLLSIGVFDEEDVKQFMEIYMSGAEPDKWVPITDAAAHRFNHEIEFDENGKADFKIKCKQFVKVYSRVAAIMDYEVLNWEKMFWFLRFLIPNLHVDVPGRDDLKDLLDSVDLNTYGLRRTGLNEKIELDSSETVLDPTKAAMAGAGTSDDAKEELDVILQEFNDKWFKGWDTTPEEQKVKLTAIVNAVKQDNDYLTLIVGNPDKQAAEEALDKIIDRIVRRQRQKDMSLYKEYMNEDFKINFRSLVTRMIETPSLVTIK